MSYQDPNQQPFGPPPVPGMPPQSPSQSQSQGQGQPAQSWGQQQQAQQQGPWDARPQQSAPARQGAWGQPQNSQGGSGGWGSAQGQIPQQPQAPQQPQNSQPGSGAWGSPQGQIPQQPNYGFGQQSGPGQSFGNSQGYGGQSFPQQGYPGQSYPPGQPGYPPQQSDFGSGGYGPGGPFPGRQRNSGLATTALWLGILGGWGVINLVIAILAINDTGPGKKLGRNKAVIGLCLTLAWTVVGVGIAFAVSSHSSSLTVSAAPSSSFAATHSATGGGSGGASPAASGTGAAGLSATGASSDPGCQAAQSAFNTYNQNAASGGIGAMQTLGNALENAAGQSQVASTQLKTMGEDYLQLANATTPSNMVSDLTALDTACGLTFTAD